MFLGIDVGTGGTRAVLVDRAGRVIASAASNHAPIHSEHIGWAEQDPDDWWRAGLEAIAGVLAAIGNEPSRIEAVGLTGQIHGCVMLDTAGHVLRPALVSIITVAGVAFGSLLSGTVLVENIFSWPGVGQYAYRSAVNLDLPAIMGVSLFVALVYIVVNLVVDLLYGVIDPRIRLS